MRGELTIPLSNPSGENIMAKRNQTPKGNKFTVKADPLKRRSAVITEMIQSGKSGGQTFTDRKKKENKERCRKIREDE
jgi:hypothetical protein